MKVAAQCRRQLHPHPQLREERGSGVPENNICWWSHSYRGQWTGGQALGMGLCCCSWAGSAAVPWPRQRGWPPGTLSPAAPSLRLHLPSHPPRVDVSHSGRYICACPHWHSCNTVFRHLLHYCTSASQWFWQSQLLYCGFLMTDYSKKESHKSCVFVVKAWEQRMSNSQSC